MNWLRSLSWKYRLALLYLIALAASTAYRHWPDGNGEGAHDGSAIRDWSSANAATTRLPTLLIGDSDADADEFESLAPELARAGIRQAIQLRLPGIGWRADGAALDPLSQAQWVAGECEQMGIARFHVLGYGYGGAVALQLADQWPQKVASVGLLSAPVSPRYELLGDKTLNRALLGFRYAWVWLGQRALPHFGLLDHGILGRPSAEADFAVDVDRRSDAFERLDCPIFLARGKSEFRVSASALTACQHVQPRSVAQTYVGGSSALLGKSASAVASDYVDFAQLAETDRAAEAHQKGRPFASLPGLRLNSLFAAGLLAVATFASEDLACIGGGLLASEGSVALWASIAGCLIGIFVGDFFIYLVGRAFGASALEMRGLRRLASPQKLERCARWFERRGVGLVVLTRFLPGSRVPTYFAAGVVKVGFWRFGFALLVASAVWTPILVGLAYALGPRFLQLFEGFGALGWLGIALLALCFVVITRLVGSCLTWRGRRLLWSRWLRLVHWEFWPVWALYPPVVVYIGWLMLRHRSLTLPSIVNPCMPASGLVFESKSQILTHLRKHGVPVARFAVAALDLPVEERMARIDSFLDEVGCGYPVVLKPDVGQRGQGVTIARGPTEARAFFADQKEDTIIQEYVPGVEFGVFYERSPRQRTGRVSSITDKRLTSVRGDGRSTLEELILKDPRAICMAAFFLKEHEASLDRVPVAGESVPLTAVGTHCRGALFLDGMALLTPELEAEVDRFSAPVEGFHFGRYDVRAPSPEAFQRGEGIRVIELNGLTSEPTSMYDPKHSVFFAWRTLMAMWGRIFAMAKENRLAGHEPDSVKSILKLAFAHARGATSKDLS